MQEYYLGMIIRPYENAMSIYMDVRLQNLWVVTCNGKELYSTVEIPIEILYSYLDQTLTVFTKQN